MRQQLALAKGDRNEVFQLRSRQRLRCGLLPDLVLQTMAKHGVRYLILLYFANFVTVYYLMFLKNILLIQHRKVSSWRESLELCLGNEGSAFQWFTVDTTPSRGHHHESPEHHLRYEYDRRLCREYYDGSHRLVAVFEWFLIRQSDTEVGWGGCQVGSRGPDMARRELPGTGILQ